MRIGLYAGGTMDIVLTGPEHKALGADRVDIKLDVRGLGPAKEWLTLTGAVDGNNAILRRKDGNPYIRYHMPKGAQFKTFSMEEVEATLTDGVVYGAKPGMGTPMAHVAPRPKLVETRPGPAVAALNGKSVEALERSVKYVNKFMRDYPDRAKMWLDDDGVLHMSLSYTYEF